MLKFNDAVRQAIAWIPQSRALAACCRTYCEYCGDPAFGIPSDPTGSGEFRFLKEVAHRLDVVLDVGANVGDWTSALLALRPSVTVHAFEPATSAHAALQRRRFPDNVAVHNTALSSKQGTASLHLFKENPQLNSLHNRVGLEACAGISPATHSEEVKLWTVDDFCATYNVQSVDLMKVDTEGHEIDVLQGSLGSLKSGRIARVQFEYGGTYIDARRLLRDAFDLFRGLDYAMFRISRNGLLACPRYDQRLEDFRYSNFVVLRSDTIDVTPSAQKAIRWANQ
jgi:FkbM family methyltransferase